MLKALGFAVGAVIMFFLQVAIVTTWSEMGLPQLRGSYVRLYVMFGFATSILGAVAFANLIWPRLVSNFVTRMSNRGTSNTSDDRSRKGIQIDQIGARFQDLNNAQKIALLIAVLAPFFLPEQFEDLFNSWSDFEDYSLLVGVWLACGVSIFLWNDR
jgi:hypothetical protein